MERAGNRFDTSAKYQMCIRDRIYVDRIVSGKLHDLNVMLEALRQTKLLEENVDPEDIVMQTLKVAQISDDDFFGSAISKDLMEILSSIREAHVTLSLIHI